MNSRGPAQWLLVAPGAWVLCVEPATEARPARQACLAWDTVETGTAKLHRKTDQTIDAVASCVSQLFDNQLRNAIEHGGEDVTVRVGWLADGPRFHIEDTGASIPAEEHARVFESGYTTATEDTSFRLPIVTEIVEAHG